MESGNGRFLVPFGVVVIAVPMVCPYHQQDFARPAQKAVRIVRRVYESLPYFWLGWWERGTEPKVQPNVVFC
jgi:hypothetical protein